MFPYLEQGALYNAINFNLSNRYSGFKANTSIMAPESPASCVRLRLFPGALLRAAIISSRQAIITSPRSAAQSTGDRIHNLPGLFAYDFNPYIYGGTWVGGQAPAISLRDITDGTSNTIAFGEWRTGDFNCAKLSIPQDVINGPPAGITFPRSISVNAPWAGAQLNFVLGLAE